MLANKKGHASSRVLLGRLVVVHANDVEVLRLGAVAQFARIALGLDAGSAQVDQVFGVFDLGHRSLLQRFECRGQSMTPRPYQLAGEF